MKIITQEELQKQGYEDSLIVNGNHRVFQKIDKTLVVEKLRKNFYEVVDEIDNEVTPIKKQVDDMEKFISF